MAPPSISDKGAPNPRRYNMPVPLIDRDLSRRLELAEGHACRRFVEARARLQPGSGAAWMEIGGALAMFDGPQSPITQTFCLGLSEAPTGAMLDAIESFYRERGAAVHHEVSPLADKSVLPLLGGRGYRPVELSGILFQPVASALEESGDAGSRIRTQVIGPERRELWARVSLEGWRGLVECEDLMLDLMRVSAAREDSFCLLAEMEREPVGAGVLCLHEGVALLGGACTVPKARGQGVQRAMLIHRLRLAADAGCDLAMINCEPGGPSHRNAERQGFRVAYTRIKWELPPATLQ